MNLIYLQLCLFPFSIKVSKDSFLNRGWLFNSIYHEMCFLYHHDFLSSLKMVAKLSFGNQKIRVLFYLRAKNTFLELQFLDGPKQMKSTHIRLLRKTVKISVDLPVCFAVSSASLSFCGWLLGSCIQEFCWIFSHDLEKSAKILRVLPKVIAKILARNLKNSRFFLARKASFQALDIFTDIRENHVDPGTLILVYTNSGISSDFHIKEQKSKCRFLN